jgi:uncharacterized protein GlcG (DUF336 family)
MTTWDAHNERRLSLQDVIDELAAERRRPVLPKGEPQCEPRRARVWLGITRNFSRREVEAPKASGQIVEPPLPLSAARNSVLGEDSLMLVSAAAADLAGLVSSISSRPYSGMVDRRLPVASISRDFGNQAAARGDGGREEQQEGWSMTNITAAHAAQLIAAAQERARSLGAACSVSVIDSGAHLLAMSRMDGASLVTIDASAAKATTAVYFLNSTANLVALIQPGAPLYTLGDSSPKEFAFVPGGVVVMVDGEVRGGVGVSGGTPDQDHEIAAAAISALVESGPSLVSDSTGA